MLAAPLKREGALEKQLLRSLLYRHPPLSAVVLKCLLWGFYLLPSQF